MEPADWPRTQKTWKIDQEIIFFCIFFDNFVSKFFMSVSTNFHCCGMWGTVPQMLQLIVKIACKKEKTGVLIIIVLSSWFYFILVTKKNECIKNMFTFQHYKVTFNSYLPSPLWLCPQTVPTIHVDLTQPIRAVDEEVEPKNIIEKLDGVCGPLPKIRSLLWTE